MYLFSSGQMAMSQLLAGVEQSPIPFGTLQDVTVDWKTDIKKLFGEYSDPVAVAAAQREITITAKNARINADILALLLSGTTSSGAALNHAVDETHVVPATPFRISTANAADTTIRLPLVRAVVSGVVTDYKVLTSGPAVAGVSCVFDANGSTITFAAADVGVTVVVSYYYADTGKVVTIKSRLMGTSPLFEVDLSNLTTNQETGSPSSWAMAFPRCISPGLKFDMKLADWVIPDFTIHPFADALGNVAYLHLVDK